MEIVKAAFTVGAFTLFSRFAGFIRELTITACLGAGVYTDAFFLAAKLCLQFVGNGGLVGGNNEKCFGCFKRLCVGRTCAAFDHFCRCDHYIPNWLCTVSAVSQGYPNIS